MSSTFDRGEKFHETMLKFFEQKRFASGFYQGIGALMDIDMGAFDLKKNAYNSIPLKGEYELIMAMGNISLYEGKPFAHTHVCLGDPKGQTFSGHLFEATVAVTAEIFLLPIDIAILRKDHPELDFKSLDLPHHFVEH
ncbi:PPC domain-containing DNA-binding protein [Simkania sp.]|uniref:PPC domain-containing DNA-binding protein n=1 Tax=Simkania sp. TaxID=34094 RepID=UPI003B520F95